METTTQDLLQRPQILYDLASPSTSTSNPINNTALLPELTEEEIDYFSTMPRGFRFCPYDVELIEDYLKNKVENKPLPCNRIIDVNVYQYNPEILAEKFAKFGENGEYFFFTPRNKKFRNGSRPNRAAGNGYWKATGADKEIKSNGVIIGLKRALVFYRGKPTCSEKTNWIMQEYCLINPPQVTKIDENDMKLDYRVLCRIYRTPERKRKRDEKNTESRNVKYNYENNMSLSIDQLIGMTQISTPNVDQNNEGLIGMTPISTSSVDQSNEELTGMAQISTPSFYQNNEWWITQISTPIVDQNNEGFIGVAQVSTPSAYQNNEGFMGLTQINTSSVDQNNEGLMGVTQVSTPSVDQNNEGFMGLTQASTPSVDQNNEGFMGVTQISTPSIDQNNEGFMGSTPSIDQYNERLMRMIQINIPSVGQNNERLMG